MGFKRVPSIVKFYRSRKWRRTRRAYLESKHYICERCGEPATTVHHQIRLTAGNVGDPSISLNPDHLEALCATCHQLEHHGGMCTAPGLAFDEEGELRRK